MLLGLLYLKETVLLDKCGKQFLCLVTGGKTYLAYGVVFESLELLQM